MPKEKAEPIKYKGKCIKMDERTWILLKDKRKKSGLSWNRYIYDLIKDKQLPVDKLLALRIAYDILPRVEKHIRHSTGK